MGYNVLTIGTLTDNGETDPVTEVPNGGMLDGSTVQVKITGTLEATVQISADGTNWHTAKDVNGVGISAIGATDIYHLAGTAHYIRGKVANKVDVVEAVFKLAYRD